jgi:hypothetical protein
MSSQLIIAKINYSPQNVSNCVVVNTTSKSSNWSRALSPFFVGPIKLYGQYSSVNMENAWQYSKVYGNHIDENNEPTEKYFEWAQNGWSRTFADRYPMGKGAKPQFSLWDGQKLSYIEARKKIYIPLYAEAVRKTEAFEVLKDLYDKSEVLVLQDFDAHNVDLFKTDLEKLISNDTLKVGHAYVLGMMLKGDL